MMYAIVNYNGNQILLEEGKKTRIPYIKDSKAGSIVTFENVLFFDDGKQKKTGNPFLKNINLKAKVLSHEKDSKIMVFKQKRRKGYQKKNTHREEYTILKFDRIGSIKKTVAKKTIAKKTTAKKLAEKKENLIKEKE